MIPDPTFPPPSLPSAPKKERSKLLLGAVIGIVSAVAVGVVGIAVTDDGSSDAATPPTTTHAPTTTVPAPTTITVAYSLSVMGEWCEDIENTYDDTWGYDDVPGMEFQVRNAQDEVIGHGALERTGTDTDESCDFYSPTIEVEESSVYQIGNPDRGYVTWDSTEVSNGILLATAVL